MFQTGFPMTILASFVGPLRLNSAERNHLMHVFAPWAIECGSSAESLLNVMFEEKFEEDLTKLREKLNVYPPRYI
jgi:ubiquinone biosynthesis protein COQ4